MLQLVVLLAAISCQIPQVGKGMCYSQNRPKQTPPITPPVNPPANPQTPSTPSTNLPRGFRGKNKGLGSYFQAKKNSDATNGRSWCGFPYQDYSNGFAPDLSVMTSGTNAVYGGRNYESSGREYCGLEAKVTNLDNGVSKIMYIIDAFDPKWVRTPGSIDIMSGKDNNATLYHESIPNIHYRLNNSN